MVRGCPRSQWPTHGMLPKPGWANAFNDIDPEAVVGVSVFGLSDRELANAVAVVRQMRHGCTNPLPMFLSDFTEARHLSAAGVRI